MKKRINLVAIIFMLVIIAVIGNYLFKRGNPDYYKNYNRVIEEPDSISVIGDQF